MIEDFFDHKCDIYHIREEQETPGFGLPGSSAFHYPEEPDIAGLSCHFGIHSLSVQIHQTEPVNIMDDKTKLTLPRGTDVRLNDRIVDIDTGFEYIADEPHNIRGHHVYVMISKKDRQRDL